MPIDGRRQKAQHVKLVGDDGGLREEATHEGPVRIAHVDGDAAYVLATGNVGERRFELGAGAALDDLHQPMVLLVDDDGDEVAEAVFSAAEEVLVDAELRRPRVLSFATLELELAVECTIQPSRRALEVAPDVHEIRVPLAGPQRGVGVALGVTKA